MEMYLFRVSLKAKGVPLSYSHAQRKPIYLVARDKEAATNLANERIHSDLEIRAVSKMARQLAPHIFSAA